MYALFLGAMLITADPDVERLVQAQESTLGLMWAVEMEIDVYHHRRGATTFSPPKHVWHYRWARDSKRERQHYRQLEGELKDRFGNPTNLGDLLDDGGIRRELKNWDEAHPQEISMERRHSVRGMISQRKPLGRSLYPNPLATFALQAIQARAGDQVWPVREFIENSPAVKRLPEVTVEGARLIPVSIAHPETRTGGPRAGVNVTMFFDPRIGHLIRKQLYTLPPNKEEGFTVPLIMEYEIKEVKDCGNGVFVPTRSVTTVTTSTEPREVFVEMQAKGSKIRVNEDVSERAFRLHFPPNLAVVDMSDPSQPRYHVWGKNDKPEKTYLSPEDVPPSYDESGGSSVWRTRAVPIVLACFVAVLIGIWVYRRRMAT